MNRAVIAVLPLCLCIVGSALGGDITWTNFGPGGGGWIQSIACDPHDPDTLYVGCDVGGFYISTDGGQSWDIQNSGLNDYFVECLAVHPKDSNIIVLGMEGGIFKSTDHGKTWQWKREGFPAPARYNFSAPIGALCFDPLDPDVLYAGIGRPRWGKDGRGHIYRSTDCGETWELLTDDGSLNASAIICDLEVAPDQSYVIAASNKGIYRSEDAGGTWSAANEGLPHTSIEEVAIAPSNPSVVYCVLQTRAVDEQAWDGGVYRSEDGGKTWAARSNGLDKLVRKEGQAYPLGSNYKEIVVDPRDPDVVYTGGVSWVSAGVFKTIDGGLNWSRSSWHFGENVNLDRGWINQWGPSVTCLALSAADPDQLVFGTSGHVYKTGDAGKTWQQRYCKQFEDGRFAGTGLEVTCMWDVVVDPHDQNRVYFCFFDIGLLVSDDQGKSFRKSNQGMAHQGNCFTVLVDPQDRTKLWACTGQWGSNRGDVCRSTDRGKTWQVVGKPETGLPDGQTKWLVLDPSSPAGNRVLYVTCNGSGIYKSEDDGKSWSAINTGLPEAAAKQPFGLAMNPADPRHLRVALAGNPPTGSGIYETKDGGAQWAKISADAPFADLKDFITDPRDFDTLYVCQREKFDRSLTPAVVFPGGLFKSTDAGKTWERVYDYHFTNCVTVSPTDSNILYVGTTDHPYHDANWAEGVAKSADGGKTWRKENEGVTAPNVSCITVDPHDPSRLYIGVGGNAGFIGVDAAIKK